MFFFTPFDNQLFIKIIRKTYYYTILRCKIDNLSKFFSYSLLLYHAVKCSLFMKHFSKNIFFPRQASTKRQSAE